MNLVFEAIEKIQRERGTSDLRVGQIIENATKHSMYHLFYLSDEMLADHINESADLYPLKEPNDLPD